MVVSSNVLTKISSNSSATGVPAKSSGTSWLSRSKDKAAAGLGLSRSSSGIGRSSKEKKEKVEETKKPEGRKIKEAVGVEPAVLRPEGKAVLGAVEDDWPLYSCRPQDYKIGQPIGFGSSSVVYRATYSPVGASPPISCAVKVIDVDKLSRVGDIDRLRQETQLMALSKHPNVLRVRGEWIEGSKLYIACRYMSPGSVLDISRYAWPDGFEETVIATVLKQTLDGLMYLHQNGWLHRDVKAANLLVDDDGTVLLADFGVSSSLFLDNSSKPLVEKLVTRKSFVGTPCWMAPEIAARKPYDAKADLWSFGITALELSSGHAPNSLFPAAKILSKTILDAPPTLDRTGLKHKFSQAMEDMVGQCLQKNPNGRPSTEKLLQHPFFKQAKKKSFLVTAILQGLPPLEERQERRRRASLAPHDTIGSWDFQATLPRHGSITESDPFSTFNSSPSPTNSSISFPAVNSGSNGRRLRERASISQHRRGVSFDLDPVRTSAISLGSAGLESPLRRGSKDDPSTTGVDVRDG